MRQVIGMMAIGLAIPLIVGCSDRSEAERPRSSDPAGEEAAQPEESAARPEESAAQPTKTPAGDATAPGELAIGRPAPSFTLNDQAGTSHQLSQYRGRIVVLEWINPRCPYVVRHYEARTMTRLEQQFPDERVVWLAIDSSNFIQPADSQAWRERHRLAYPILQDPSGQVGRLYEARTTPHMFVIDAEGVLRYRGAIDDDPRGRNDEDTNYVEQAVNALLAGQAPPTAETQPYGCTVKYEGVT